MWYCSKRCQKEQWSAHKTICQAIKELSQRENQVILETAFISHLTPTQHAKVVNLVGRKCTVKCLLDDNEVTALWDTGAQVSIMTRGMLEEKLPGTVVRDISELISVGLDLTAANGTKIPFIGWADVRVRLPSSAEEVRDVHVPFLITVDRLEMPILGYNVIEELVKTSTQEGESTSGFNILSAFKKGFADSDERQLETLMITFALSELQRKTLSSRGARLLMFHAGQILGLCQQRYQFCSNLMKWLNGQPVSRFMKR